MKYGLVALFLLMLAAPATAQDTDHQIWASATAGQKIGTNLGLSLEGIARFGDAADGLYEAEFGGFVFTSIGKVEFGLGYLRVPGYRDGRAFRVEDRPRQQVATTVAVLGGRLNLRARLEQRARSDGDDLGWRLRPALRYSRPVRTDSPTSFVLSHESFIGLNDTDWGQRGGYERMRNFAGVRAPLAKAVAIEAGYLNQYGIGRGGRRDTMDHVASVALIISR